MQVISDQLPSQQKKLKMQELRVHFLQSVIFSCLHMLPSSCSTENVISWYKALKGIAIHSCNLQVNILSCKVDEYFGLVFITSNWNWQETWTYSFYLCRDLPINHGAGTEEKLNWKTSTFLYTFCLYTTFLCCSWFLSQPTSLRTIDSSGILWPWFSFL